MNDRLFRFVSPKALHIHAKHPGRNGLDHPPATLESRSGSDESPYFLVSTRRVRRATPSTHRAFRIYIFPPRGAAPALWVGTLGSVLALLANPFYTLYVCSAAAGVHVTLARHETLAFWFDCCCRRQSLERYPLGHFCFVAVVVAVAVEPVPVALPA